MRNTRNILYAKFKTKDNHYIYDTYSNNILVVSKVTWDIIDDYIKNPDDNTELFDKHNYKKEEVLKSIKEIKEGRSNGFLQPIELKNMYFYESDKKMIEEIKHKITQLTLEATQNCNFRCKYCVYSGEYLNSRNHSNQNMDWQTAVNAIKIFIGHSAKADIRNISFYGGEPLLNFNLMRKTVNYVKEHYPDKDVHYNFTTNGSLFNDENIEFFIENDIRILISLNGPPDINDKYRVDLNNNGTFSRIMRGIQKIIKKDEEYYQKYISFSCVLTPQTSFTDLLSFFSEDNLFINKNISFSSVDSHQTLFFDKYGDYAPEQYDYLDNIYFNTAINNLLPEKRVVSKLKGKAMLNIFRRNKQPIMNRIYPNGCCIPLLKKMFVDVEGNIHTCERVPTYNPLGNVNSNGIDYDLIVKFVQEYTKNSLKDCKYCWAVRMCPSCYKHFMKNHKWNDSEREQVCRKNRNGLIADFELYTSILERNRKAFDYMNDIEIEI